MGGLKVGVMIESFRLGVKKGIRKAAELGADGFQIYVTGGEMAPWNLSRTGRRDFAHFVESQGLVVSALCGDFGGGGFVRREGLDERIDRTKQVLDLSHDLGVRVVTTHIGVIPADENAPERAVMREALGELGDYAEKAGAVFASETGPEDTRVMADFLRSLPTDTVRVNYDPANLVMTGFDEVRGVHDLADFIVHTHAKDGVRTAEGGHKEVPLGQGGRAVGGVSRRDGPHRIRGILHHRARGGRRPGERHPRRDRLFAEILTHREPRRRRLRHGGA